jgi:NADH-quinone oxidoreductase subunit M
VILAAVYLLWAFQRAFTGEPEGDNRTIADLDVREMAAVLPLLGLAVVLGVYPKPVLDRVEPSARALVEHVESRTDYTEPDLPDDIEGRPLESEDHGDGAEEHEEELDGAEEGLAPAAPPAPVAEVGR